MSLYQRLALSLTVVFAVLIYLVMWWSGELQKNTQLESEQRLHLGLAEHLVHDNPLLAQGVYDYDGLKNLFHTLMMLGPSFEFYYVDPNGKIVTYSAEPGKVKRDSIDVKPIQKLLNNSVELPILGDDPRHSSRQKIFSTAPVYNGKQLQGYLYMIIGGEIHDSVLLSVQQNQSLRHVSLVALSSIGVLLILLLVLFRVFTAPLCSLSRQLAKIEPDDLANENFDIKWPSSKDIEITRLTKSFDVMLNQIQIQFVQLQNIDEHRRILLADLSHDLRTPLANLQGYIETLAINGDKLSSEERNKFIDISMRNAKNLKRLIDQIFELAYLEGGQVRLQREAFPLGELLYDVAAKFELKVQEKQLTLNIEPSQFEHQVFADIAKLERVLTNLIDNAIRHTEHDGQITLAVSELSSDPSKLKLSVLDTGIGINKHEIAHVFDARYRASNSQEDKNTHVGLGLAISKKLVQLLESDLNVESELGRGTTFSFELSLA